MFAFFVRYRRIFVFVIAVALFFWLAWVLRNVLIPFFVGLILAYLLYPPMRWIEKQLPVDKRWNGIIRVILIFLVYLIVLGIIGGVGYLVIPSIVNSATEFFSNLPELVPDFVDRIQSWMNSLRNRLPDELRSQIDTYLSSLTNAIGSAIQDALIGAIGLLTANINLIIGFAALPVFLFYILKDAEKLTNSFYSSLTPWASKQSRGIIDIIRNVFGRYIRAQLILGLVVGGLDFIGLTVLGVPFAPALAAWAGISELIPVIGPWLGGAAGVIVTLAVDPGKTIWVALMYFIVQMLENNLLVPRITGGILQIHPAIVLLLLVLGGYFAGFWGILLIVPLTATLVQLFKFIAGATHREAATEVRKELIIDK